jgi:NAD(P)H-nitrite reductase large subunit
MKIEQIVKIAEAIKSVEDVKLEFKVSYRLGRLYDKLESIMKNYGKQELAIRQEYAKRFQEASEEDKPKINDEFIQKMNEIMQIEEEVKMPELKLDDFSKEIPVKFFTAFGEHITE